MAADDRSVHSFDDVYESNLPRIAGKDIAAGHAAVSHNDACC